MHRNLAFALAAATLLCGAALVPSAASAGSVKEQCATDSPRFDLAQYGYGGGGYGGGHTYGRDYGYGDEYYKPRRRRERVEPDAFETPPGFKGKRRPPVVTDGDDDETPPDASGRPRPPVVTGDDEQPGQDPEGRDRPPFALEDGETPPEAPGEPDDQALTDGEDDGQTAPPADGPKDRSARSGRTPGAPKDQGAALKKPPK